ncbi:hypothetical protein QJS04_geneDACA004474 [Acorus gramineus]|uniref:Uncharacterized protein n=1 Tax=Acorus gramineus TaxID=55184 RepID=A0AAV9B3S3_ACOGR|nr:hypothetical protein QJS04_geneDACA004474 [Acorus gramineus]
MKTSSPHTSSLSLALLLLLITISLAEAIHVKRPCNGTVVDCNDEEEWLMESDTVRRLLQTTSGSYASLQTQSACAGSNGGAYENTCFSQVNTPSRGCDPIYGCRS